MTTISEGTAEDLGVRCGDSIKLFEVDRDLLVKTNGQQAERIRELERELRLAHDENMQLKGALEDSCQNAVDILEKYQPDAIRWRNYQKQQQQLPRDILELAVNRDGSMPGSFTDEDGGSVFAEFGDVRYMLTPKTTWEIEAK